MKKIIYGLGFASLLISGCSADTGSSGSSEQNTNLSSQAELENSSTLNSVNNQTTSAIVYFSRSGNTEDIAEFIQAETNSDIFSIQSLDDYPENYSELLDYIQEQISQNQLPQIISPEIDFSKYERIYIGTPIWFNDLSLPIRSWIEEVNLNNIEIVPFYTSGSSSLTNAQASLATLLSNTTITEGIVITDSNRENYSTLVSEWLNDLD